MIKNKSQEFNLTAGIASSASDKLTLSKKFKTLHNVEQNDDLGAITARHGTAKAAAFWPYRFQNLIALTKQNGDYIGLAKNEPNEHSQIVCDLIKITKGSQTPDILNPSGMPGIILNTLQEIYGINTISAVDTYVSFPRTLIGQNNNNIFSYPIKYKKGTTKAMRHGAYAPVNVSAKISNCSGPEIVQYYPRFTIGVSFLYADGSESAITETASSKGYIVTNRYVNFYVKAKLPLTIEQTANTELYITGIRVYLKMEDTAIFNNATFYHIGDSSIIDKTGNWFYAFGNDVYTTTWAAPASAIDITENNYTPLSLRLDYIPRPTMFLLYKGLLFGLGDPNYPRTIFPSTEFKSEFNADSGIEIQMPNGDDHITGGAVIGNSLFVFSENGIYRVSYQGVTGIEFTVETIPTSIGCIAPMTITEAYGSVYFLSKQGIVKFDGFNISIESTDIQDIFKNLLLEQYYIQDGYGYQLWFYPPYIAKAAFNKKNDCLYFALPINSNDNNAYYQYFLKTKAWRTVELPDFKDFVRGADDGSMKYVTTDGYIREFIDTCADYTGDTAILDTAENIDATIETHSQYFGERTLFQAIRFFGTGTVNITVTIDRGRRMLTFPNKVLTELGPEIKLNTQGTEFSWKIDVLTSETFKLKGVELFYANEGAKQRQAPANAI